MHRINGALSTNQWFHTICQVQLPISQNVIIIGVDFSEIGSPNDSTAETTQMDCATQIYISVASFGKRAQTIKLPL